MCAVPKTVLAIVQQMPTGRRDQPLLQLRAHTNLAPPVTASATLDTPELPVPLSAVVTWSVLSMPQRQNRSIRSVHPCPELVNDTGIMWFYRCIITVVRNRYATCVYHHTQVGQPTTDLYGRRHTRHQAVLQQLVCILRAVHHKRSCVLGVPQLVAAKLLDVPVCRQRDMWWRSCLCPAASPAVLVCVMMASLYRPLS